MKHKKYIGFGILILAVILLLWTLWGNTAPALTAISAQSERLPQAFDGYRIAQISDLHNAELGENNSRLISLLKKANPDLIAVTGDIIDSSRTDLAVAVDFLRQAVEIAPCVAITGNHEAWVSEETYAELEAQMTALGIAILHDEAMSLTCGGETLTLLGIDDPDYAQRHGGVGLSMSPDSLRALCPTEQYTVLLSHRPEFFEQYCRAEFDLVLSGHAHGGQFRLPLIGGLIAPDQGLFPKYDTGSFIDGNTHMIVSRGIGNSIIPIRFNNRPEIVVVTLTCA